MSFVWSNYATCNLCMDITNKRLSQFLGKLKWKVPALNSLRTNVLMGADKCAFVCSCDR